MQRILVLAVGLLFVSVLTASTQQAGPATRPGPGKNVSSPNFVDADGDGICDLFQSRAGQGQGQGRGKRGGYGPGDGTGHQGVGPRDGTGFGPGSGAGNGTCDGTGPKGQAAKRGGPRR